MFVNTKESVCNPADVNSQGQIDEEGDGEEVGESNDNVNDFSAINAEEGDEEGDEEEDSTPAIHSVTVTHNGKQTDIVARIATSSGWQNKRLVLPGHLTAKRLADALITVAVW